MITPEDERASILLAHPDPMRRTELRGDLEAIGHSVVGEASTAAELAAHANDVTVEVIVTAARFGDGTGASALIDAARTAPRPGIVIATAPERHHLEEALRDHVLGFLVEPVDRADLGPLIHLVRERFAEFEDLRAQVDDLESALEARKLIERAKGLLMAARGLDERGAHRTLQKRANDRRAKLLDTARELLDAHAAGRAGLGGDAIGGLDAEPDDASPV